MGTSVAVLGSHGKIVQMFLNGIPRGRRQIHQLSCCGGCALPGTDDAAEMFFCVGLDCAPRQKRSISRTRFEPGPPEALLKMPINTA